MAKTTRIGYSGSLTLDKIVGVRMDNRNKFINAPVKPSNDLPVTTPSRKTVRNITSDGLKKS